MIYFIQQGDDGPVKVGYTGGPASERIKNLQVSTPMPLGVLFTCDGSKIDEAAIHRRFKKLRLKGEWFRPEKGLMEFIEELKTGEAKISRVMPVDRLIVELKRIRHEIDSATHA